MYLSHKLNVNTHSFLLGCRGRGRVNPELCDREKSQSNIPFSFATHNLGPVYSVPMHELVYSSGEIRLWKPCCTPDAPTGDRSSSPVTNLQLTFRVLLSMATIFPWPYSYCNYHAQMFNNLWGTIPFSSVHFLQLQPYVFWHYEMLKVATVS